MKEGVGPVHNINIMTGSIPSYHNGLSNHRRNAAVRSQALPAREGEKCGLRTDVERRLEVRRVQVVKVS